MWTVDVGPPPKLYAIRSPVKAAISPIRRSPSSSIELTFSHQAATPHPPGLTRPTPAVAEGEQEDQRGGPQMGGGHIDQHPYDHRPPAPLLLQDGVAHTRRTPPPSSASSAPRSTIISVSIRR